jgi:TM2 domain-containing membrane protein YozV/predicted transcriptional regulator
MEAAMYSIGLADQLGFLSGCGALGFHRFYLGKIPSGVLWMCTGGLGMIGSVYDFLTLPGQVREANIRSAIYNGAGAHRGPGWRYVNDGEAHVVREKETVERIILRLAKENKGVLTTSEVALAANISIDQAKKDLDALVSKGIAELRVRKTGTLVYTLPEMMDRDEPLEDF